MPSARGTAMLRVLEGLWANFDDVFAVIERDGRWREPHGSHWLLRDVPSHLVYYDREVVAEALERGTNVAVKDQRAPHSIRELNAWNERMIAQRPADEAPRQSFSRWRAVRERIRKRVADLDDKGLEQAVWVPLPGLGWLTASDAIASCISHTWGELVVLREVSNISEGKPSLDATRAALAYRVERLTYPFNAEAGGDIQLTTVLSFPGAGDWTVRVVNGAALVEEGAASDAGLVITQSPVTYALIEAGKLDEASALRSEELQVSDTASYEVFRRLFPQPSLDTPIPPTNPGAKD